MYEINIQVRYSETDPFGKVRLHQILDYFQDTATFQSLALGLELGGDHVSGHAWYLLAWEVTIVRYAEIGEKLSAVTDPYKMKGYYGYRRFYLRDSKGELIAYADSIWVLMDTTKILPVKVSEELKEAFLNGKKDEEAKIKRKLPAKGDWKKIESIEITNIFLDSNLHVNNTFYVQWAESIIPADFCAGKLKVDYRQAALKGDTIYVYCDIQDDLYRVKYVNQNNVLIALVDMLCVKRI